MSRKLALSCAIAGGILTLFIFILLALFCLPLVFLALLLLILGLGMLKRHKPEFFEALRKPKEGPGPLVSRLNEPPKHENAKKTYLMLINLNTSNRYRITVDNSYFVIGRDKGCNFVLDDPQVSRRHAIIEYDDADKLCYVQNVSINGTLLNNQPLKKGVRYPLRQSDLLQFSSIVFTVETAHF